MTLDTTYLVPLRASTAPSPDLVRHLVEIAEYCSVLVVDSSDDDVFDAAHAAFGETIGHVRPDRRHRCANGKVSNVSSGLDLVTTSTVVIADDDVRHTPDTLLACVAATADADLVCPQNHFVALGGSGLPWHAVWDTARTLLNRATGGDMPGTMVVRTAVLRRTGGYDGDVLFENLELMRTVRAAGGRCRHRPDIYVARRPPTTEHFLGQRVRQAYDEFARPWRLAAQLGIVPLLVVCSRPGRRHLVPALAAAAVVLAELGRRRHGGAARFPRGAALCAPLWSIERGICSWLAVVARLRGGVVYGGGRLAVAAHPTHRIRARLRAAGGRAVERSSDPPSAARGLAGTVHLRTAVAAGRTG